MNLKKISLSESITLLLEKTMENLRKHRDIKSALTDEKRSKLISEPSYHTKEQFSEKLLTIEMKKIWNEQR